MNIQIARPMFIAALTSAFVHSSPLTAQSQAPKPLTVSVSSDGRDLEIKQISANDTVHVLDQCGNPAVGKPIIRHISIEQDSVTATYGKHCFAKVSLKTLRIECAGCD